MTLPLKHHSQGRSQAAAISLLAVFAILGALVVFIDLNFWIAGILLLFTLPAIWEYITNPLSEFELTEATMRWSSPTVNDELALALIQRVRFDTRLDLSVKVTMILNDGRKLRLPHACTPPHQALEEALKQLKVATERHHFSLIG